MLHLKTFEQYNHNHKANESIGGFLDKLVDRFLKGIEARENTFKSAVVQYREDDVDKTLSSDAEVGDLYNVLKAKNPDIAKEVLQQATDKEVVDTYDMDTTPSSFY